MLSHDTGKLRSARHYLPKKAELQGKDLGKLNRFNQRCDQIYS